MTQAIRQRPIRPSIAPSRPAAGLALAVALCTACVRQAPQRAPALVSRIELAAGNVLVRVSGGDWQPAGSGLLLRHGTWVRTGSGDRALIRMDDGSAVFLRHETDVSLEPRALRLQRGEVWIDAPVREEREPLRYLAGDTVVSAAATGLDLRRSGEQLEVYVARGLAVVETRGGRTEVQAGERVRLAPGRAPALEPVPFWEDWTGGMADRDPGGSGGAAAGRIYAIDRSAPGRAPLELQVQSQRVQVALRAGVARTTVDQTFFNAGDTAVEGYYWFTVPEGAAVDRFALDVGGQLIEGEVVERQQAARRYEQAARSGFEPALLEWVDARTFRARIFPIAAAGARRVVLSYLELLPALDGTLQYLYPMAGLPRVQEFALEVDLGQAGRALRLATTSDARIEDRGSKVTMRRSGYRPAGDFLLELVQSKVEPLRAARVASTRGEADYVMLRYAPDLDWSAVKPGPGEVVVAVDTSASGDEAERQLRSDIAEAVLRALSSGDRFALVAVDLKPRVLYPPSGLAPATEAEVGRALEQLAAVSRGGATDLGAVLDVALQRVHGAKQPAVVYVGDGLPTVGELDGEALAERVTRSIASSPARFFTIGAGPKGDHALLERLARLGGGRAFRVDAPQQAVQESLRFVGALKTATITDLTIDAGAGLDQVFLSTAGKLSRGEELVLLARTHHPLPETVRVSGALGGVPFAPRSYRVVLEEGQKVAYVPKLWARRYLTQLLGTDRVQNRGAIVRLGVDYSLMTPFSSFLVLESEAAYQQLGIPRTPRDPLWGLVPQAVLETVAGAPRALFGSNSDSPDPQREPLERTRVESLPSPQAGRESTAWPRPDVPRPPSVGAAARSQYLVRGRRQPSLNDLRASVPSAASAPEAEPRAAPRPSDREGDALKAVAAATDALGPRDSEPAEEADDEDERTVVAPSDSCSDASRGPLYYRLELWRQRLDVAGQVAGWIAVYREAADRCELPHGRDRRALLELIQQRVVTTAQAASLLGALQGSSRAFVRRQLMRRAIDADFAAALGGRDPVNWAIADGVLARVQTAEERIRELRRLCGERSTSLGCVERLVAALRQASQPDQALVEVERARANGLLTPRIVQLLGDLLVELGRVDDARRAYSELVEFAPSDPNARQLLGDIYRRQGWHQDAYRQYQTLVARRREDPTATLRLAAAAAGSGRVDQALRLERQVAGGEGEPGPADPRRWARLWSALRLARLLTDGTQRSASTLQGLQRSLQRLQLQPTPGVLALLSWDDLDATLALELGSAASGRVAAEAIDAARTGLFALSLPGRAAGELPLVLRGTRLPGTRRVAARLTLLRWDGRSFHATQQELTLPPPGDAAGGPVAKELLANAS